MMVCDAALLLVGSVLFGSEEGYPCWTYRLSVLLSVVGRCVTALCFGPRCDRG